ncbi:hypothetical protein E0H77_13420 [Acinetobacter sp. ANC 4633]|uniref:hypothetical protein n=1 Tax=Acinetobacter sp. ANC 4633 TaxID=2529845 RepID=UPI00103D4D58|nr:hypothetical protein [Acinetobacter sp. ANC 4633]TCB23127.1 hypothetical protein E0H77_13420 [Acinetobacter sp. ANC 4633]
MNMEYLHKPDYFFFAHKMVLFLEKYIKQHPMEQEATFHLQAIYDLFGQDRASSTINLEGILNIVDEYLIDTQHGIATLIHDYSIHLDNHILTLNFHPHAMQSVSHGASVFFPKVA